MDQGNSYGQHELMMLMMTIYIYDLVWIGFMAYINHYWLFNAKSCLYIYIKYIYIYIYIYIICKHIL